MSKKKSTTPAEEKLDKAIEEAEVEAIDEAVLEDEDRLASLTQEELVVECEQAQQSANESLDKLVRMQAEMENVRRRTERDVVSAHKYGTEKLIKELLPVVDSLERGLELEAENTASVKAMHEGMEMTLKILLETLEKHGVKKIDPSGEPFDPQEMEAIAAQPDENVDANTVLKVVQCGYSLNDRLVRPAMVIVSQ